MIYCYDKDGNKTNTYSSLSVKWLIYMQGQRIFKGKYKYSYYYGLIKEYEKDESLPEYHYLVGPTKQYILDWLARNEFFDVPDHVGWRLAEGDVTWESRSALEEIDDKFDYHCYPNKFIKTLHEN